MRQLKAHPCVQGVDEGSRWWKLHFSPVQVFVKGCPPLISLASLPSPTLWRVRSPFPTVGSTFALEHESRTGAPSGCDSRALTACLSGLHAKVERILLIPIGLQGSKKSQLQWTGLESRKKEKRKKEKRKINKTQRARKRKGKKRKGRIWERNNYIKISLWKISPSCC